MKNLYALFCLSVSFLWGCFLYRDSLSHLFGAWQTQEYGHGFLLPVISFLWGLYLLQKEPITLSSFWGGLGIVAGALTLNTVGIVISNNWVSNISMVVFIAGIIVTFLGISALRRGLPVLVLLVLAIPLPATLLPILTADLQLMSSSLGTILLHLFRIPSYQEGNIIDLGDYKLDVAVACSGLRYLFPLLSLSYLMSAFFLNTWWKKTVLFLSAIPISLGLNALRIALSGVLYTFYGAESIEGFFHDIEGYVIFAFCLMALSLVQYILGLLPPYDEKKRETDPSFSFEKFQNNAWRKPSAKSLFALFFTFCLFTGIAHSIEKTKNLDLILERKSFIDFPLQIGNWAGQKDRLPLVELETLNLTDHFVGNYVYEGKQFAPINLYIAYYDQQTQENSIHSPQICLPGSGWIVISHEIRTIGPLRVNKEILQKNNEKLLVYYWFRETGIDAATNFEVKKILLMNALKNGRTDGSLIRLVSPLNGDQPITDVQEQMDDFLKNLMPRLLEFLPGPNDAPSSKS